MSMYRTLLLSILIVLFSISANAKVIITENQRLAFPVFERPISGQIIIEVTPNGAIGGATTANIINSTQANGYYLVSSNNKNRKDVTLNISNISAPSGVTVDEMVVTYGGVAYTNFPVLNLPAPDTGVDLKVGAKVTFDSTLQEGDYSLSYQISVDEQ
jgi:hypothetical protein